MMQKLGDIATYINGYAFKPADRGLKGLPIIRIQDLTGNSYDLGFYDGIYPKKIEINNGDILISWSGSLGIFLWNGGKALLNQHIFKVVLEKKDIDKHYFLFAVKEKLNEMSLKTHGATMKHIIKSDFENITISLPDLNEQKRISNMLLKIENLIKMRKNQIQHYDTLTKSLFVEMFGDTVINPLGWEEHKLEEYIDFLTSGSRGWAKYFVNEENELFLTIKNVKNNKIVLDDIQYIKAPKNKEAERTKVKCGDLLISITADLGRTGVIDKDISSRGAYINQHLSLVRLDQNRINPQYISYYLETDAGKRQFCSKNQNGVKAGLNFDAIKSLNIIVPPIELQDDFVKNIYFIDKHKSVIQKSLDETQLLFDSLMQKYFG